MDIIVDIDGTLADLTHRLHFLEKKDYDGFYGAMGEDTPKTTIITIIQALQRMDHKLLLCSGRPDNYRMETAVWLENKDIRFKELYMRPAGDFRPDHVIKEELYNQMLADGYHPVVAIDDRPSIITMWKSKGLEVLRVEGWDERGDKVPQGMLTLMVGPSGAGKSTWLWSKEAVELGITPLHVISSDQCRHDICGDFRDQSKNAQVFRALHAAVKARIDNGLHTVVDATNIKDADRKAIVALAHDKSKVRYVVIDRPMAEKIKDAGWRASVKIGDQSLIEKHAQTFHSNLKAILSGDGIEGVKVYDYRRTS